jgi:chaperonin GroES
MFKPIQNYVLLERIAEETVTAGGIYIPDNTQEKPCRGRVISVGNVVSVKPEDIVLFSKWGHSAQDVNLAGKDYVLIKETDILGIIEKC